MISNKGNENFGFSAPPELVEEMDKIAEDMSMNRSEFIRFLFRFWLRNGRKIKVGEKVAV